MVDGGVGSQLRDALEDASTAEDVSADEDLGEDFQRPPVARVGVPREFLATAERAQLLADFGMDASGIRRTIAAVGRRS